MPEAPVTPEVVEWAIDESGLSEKELALRLKVEENEIAAWTCGRSRPSSTDLTSLSRVLKRPRAMFFLPEPPTMDSLPPKLRTPAGVRVLGAKGLAFDERLQIRRARRIQSLLTRLAPSSANIPRADPGDSPAKVAGRLTAWTGVTPEARMAWESATGAFCWWRSAIESHGVAVLALPMGLGGIRGFALKHETAPLVAVNTADIPEARCFTMFHELAHLALAEDSSCTASSRDGVERWCDRVAGEILIPRTELRVLVGKLNVDGLDLVKAVATRFKSSRRAAAIALEDSNLVEDAYIKVEKTWPAVDRTRKGGGGGGRQSPRICVDRYGAHTVRSFLGALDRGAMGELEVSDYLNLDRSQLRDAGDLVLA